MADAAYDILLRVSGQLGDMTKFQAQLLKANEETAKLRASMAELSRMAKFGAVFAAAGLTLQNFVGQVTAAIGGTSALSDEIERAAGRAGLGAEAYQTFAAAARQAGTDVGEVLASMQIYRRTLGDVLGGANPQAHSAFAELGLDARELTKLAPERQLEKIAAALMRVADENRRASLASDLFGRGSAALLPLLSSLATDGFDQMKSSAAAASGLLSGQLATALDDAGDRASAAQKRLSVAMAQFNLSIVETKATLNEFLANNGGSIGSALSAAISGGLLGGALIGLSKVKEKLVTDGAATFANAGKMLATPFAAAFALAAGALIINEIQRVMLEANAAANAAGNAAHARLIAHDAALGGMRSPADAARARAAIEAGIAKLTAPNSSRKEYTDAGHQGFRMVPAFDAGNLGSAQQLELTGLREKLKLTSDLNAQTIIARNLAADATRQAALDATTAAQTALTEAEERDLETIARQQEQRLRLQAIFDDDNAQWELARQVVEANLTPLERYNRELDRLEQIKSRLPAETFDRARTAAKDAFDRATAAPVEILPALQANLTAFQTAVNSMWQNVSDRAGQAFADMVVEGRASFSELARIVARTLTQIVVQLAIINPIINGFMGLFGATGFTPLATMWGGKKAGGGPVDAGRIHLVGEEGPELFMPRSSGSILPAGTTAAALGSRGGRGGGGITIHQAVNISTGVQETVRAEVLGLLPTLRTASVDGLRDAIARNEIHL